jgi:hypothetical protein
MESWKLTGWNFEAGRENRAFIVSSVPNAIWDGANWLPIISPPIALSVSEILLEISLAFNRFID